MLRYLWTNHIAALMVNSGFILGDEKTLIIDSGGNYLSGKTIFGYAKAVKPDNELTAINTEPHFYHVGGNCFFNEMGMNIYGRQKIIRNDNELEEVKKEYKKCITSNLRKNKNEEEFVFYKTKVVNPNIMITTNTTIDLGGLEVDVILTPGHTKMNLSIYVKED